MSRRVDRAELFMLMVMAALLGALYLSGCGPSSRQRAAATTMRALDAADAGFEAWEEKHIAEIVAAAPDKATGDAELDHYAAQQGAVEGAFAAAYRAVAGVSIGGGAIDVAAMTAAAGAVYSAVDQLEGGAP